MVIYADLLEPLLKRAAKKRQLKKYRKAMDQLLVSADRDHLTEMVNNLLDGNALKSSDVGDERVASLVLAFTAGIDVGMEMQKELAKIEDNKHPWW